MRARIVLLLALGVVLSSTVHAGSYALEYADHVVINEVDTNPPGDDARSAAEWVEIYNPTSESVAIGGWEIGSAADLKRTLVIQPSFEIKPGQYQIFSYQPSWFNDMFESVVLRDSEGIVVDRTPYLSDAAGDYNSWQRVYDGLDSGSDSDWVLKTSTVGGANGAPEAAPMPDPVSITVGPDEDFYLLGQTAVISGNVSEQVFVEKPTFFPSPILITVDGPSSQNTVTLYPDVFLEFSTSLALHKVLGFEPGTYNVTAEYSGAVGTAQFSLGSRAVETTRQMPGVLSIQTDSDSYIPGETATVSATTTREVPYEGLEFSVIDPDGNVLEGGNLFPSSGANASGAAGSGIRASFATEVFIDNVSPVYGQHQITARYSTQVAEHHFMVEPDRRDPSIVALETGKDVYQPGDTVSISGRSNLYHVPSLSLEILRPASLAPGTAGGAGLKVLDTLRLEGDGTFAYDLPIPDSFVGFGEYRVTVSGEVGTFATTFAIVEDSGAFVKSTDPLAVSVDRESYGVGDPLRISGFVKDPGRSGGLENPSVHIEIRDSDNKPLSIEVPHYTGTRNAGTRIALSFDAIPDPAGRFSVDSEITRGLFPDGVYTVLAKYGRLASEASFAVADSTGAGDAVAFLDREVYGLGQTLTLSGSLGTRVAGGESVQITLYKPDGDTDRFEAGLDGGDFVWNWNTPAQAVVPSTGNERAATSGNLGVYRISLEAGGDRSDLFFKVSENPGTDTLSRAPITVDAGQSLYRAGDKLYVSGYVVPRAAGHDGPVAADLVTVMVMPTVVPMNPIHTATVYPDHGGYYSATFELQPSLFDEGTFKVRAVYNNTRAEADFSVANSYLLSDEDPELILTLDKDSYNPGDVLTLNGRPSTIVQIGRASCRERV